MSYSHYSDSARQVPSRFTDSKKHRNGKANESLKTGGSFKKLLDILKDPFTPYFYSLHHHHLGIDKEFAASHLIYDHHAIKAWKMVLKDKIEPPYFFRFEVGIDLEGNLGNLHTHLIADEEAGLLWIPRGGEVIKPLGSTYEDAKRLKAYLSKPPVPKCDQALKEYKDALKRILEEHRRDPRKPKNVPQISGYEWGNWG